MKKRIFYGICMLGLAALVATSCKKKEETVNSFLATHGTFEVADIDDERAYIHPQTYLTVWDDQDQVKIFNFYNGRSAIFQVERSGVGQNTATFVNTGESIGYAPEYYSFYPAEMARDSFDGVYQKFELEPIQYVREFSNDGYSYGLQTLSIPQAAYTTYQQNHYVYKIIFGVVRFKATCDPSSINGGSRYVRKIVVRDNHFNLHGTVTLKPNKINQSKLNQLMTYLKNGNDEMYAQKWSEYIISHEGDGLGYSSHGAGKELTYDFSALQNVGNGVALNNVDPRSMMIGLRPGALAYGFYVDFYVYDSGDDQEKKITIKTYKDENRAYTIEPGKIKTFDLGDITPYIDAWPGEPEDRKSVV